jgi:hypothetical protein
MTKNKKTKAKVPAQAKVISEIAQPVAPKTVKQPATAKAAVEPVKPAAIVKPVQAVKPTEPAGPVVTPKPAEPKVRLEFSKPGAHSVAVAGSFNSWQPEQASSTGKGGWVKELAVGPGRYEYMFVVDGQWMADPNAKEFAPNPFGGQNSVLVVNQ